MRAVKMLFTGSVAGAFVAILACGGSGQVSPGPTDSGTPDATFDLDAGDAAVCTIDADLNTASPIDAALDEGGASVGTCIGCARAHCAAQISTCNVDCSCNSAFSCLFNCLGSIGGSLLVCYTTCGGSLALSTPTPETELVICAAKSCATACAACGIPGISCAKDASTPPDSATPDSATDAPSDAPADAPSDAPADAKTD